MGTRTDLLGVAIGCCFATHLALAQLTPAEQQIVRRTYARLAAATEIRAVEHSLGATPNQLAANLRAHALEYDIVSLSGGDIADILDTPYSRLVSKPAGDALSLGPSQTVHTAYGVETREAGANAHWVQGQAMSDDWSRWSLRDILAGGDFPGTVRYATVNLIVTLAGRSRAYNALFLFDSKGNAKAIDMVSDSSTLLHFIQDPVYPHILLEAEPYRNDPTVQLWTKASVLTACPNGKGNECCDLAALRCGITAEDLPASSAKPEQNSSMGTASASTATPTAANVGCAAYSFAYPPIPLSSSDNSEHSSGSHTMASVASGICTYTNPPSGAVCLTSAVATVSPGTSDTGVVSTFPFCHKGGWNNTDGVASGVGAVTTPPAIGAAAFLNCLGCGCGVNVSLSGPGGSISFPPSAVWSHTVAYPVSCPAFPVSAPPPQGPGFWGPGPFNPCPYDYSCDDPSNADAMRRKPGKASIN